MKNYIIHQVHHVLYSYGYVVFPFLKKSIGVFPSFSRRNNCSIFQVVEKEHFHDCTKTGVR